MKEKIVVLGSDIGFVGLLQIAFIVLKLCEVINWSWWLVFLPFLIPVGLSIIITIIALIIPLIDGLVNGW